MSNKDFQNGFALGRASGGVNNSTLTEEYLAQQLAEFKEKEIAYNTIYSYDTALLSEKSPIADLKNAKAYRVVATTEQTLKDDETAYRCHISIALMVAQTDNTPQGFKKVVESPFEISANETILQIENIDVAKDIAIMSEEEGLFFLSDSLPTLVGDDMFYSGDFFFTTQRVDFTGGCGLYLMYEIKLYTLSKELSDTVASEFGEIFKSMNPLLLYCQHTPEIETINAEYLGE